MVEEISAGGIVYRRQGTAVDFLMILDAYGQWTFPKGGVEEGESLEEAALREIREETGVVGEIVDYLGEVHYQYHHPTAGAVQKTVHFFLIEARTDDIIPQVEEIRKAAWVAGSEVGEFYGYESGRTIIDKAKSALRPGE